MATIFDMRNFNDKEKNDIKVIVDDTIEVLQQIEDLQTHMKENIKGLCDKLNEGYDSDQKVKPSFIKGMAKAKIKEKEDIMKKKEELNEVEEGLQILYHM